MEKHGCEEVSVKWQSLFKNMGFAVPHKSFVVNLRHIKDIKGCDLLMTTGEIVPLSQKESGRFSGIADAMAGAAGMKGEGVWHLRWE